MGEINAINRRSFAFLGVRFLGIILVFSNIFGIFSSLMNEISYEILFASLVQLCIGVYFLRRGSYVAKKLTDLLPEQPLASYSTFAVLFLRIIGVYLFVAFIGWVASFIFRTLNVYYNPFSGNNIVDLWLNVFSLAIQALSVLLLAVYLIAGGGYAAKLILIFMPENVRLYADKARVTPKAVYNISIGVLVLKYCFNSLFLLLYSALIILQADWSYDGQFGKLNDFLLFNYTCLNIPRFAVTLIAIVYIRRSWNRQLEDDESAKVAGLREIGIQFIKYLVFFFVLLGIAGFGNSLAYSIFYFMAKSGGIDYKYLQVILPVNILYMVVVSLAMFFIAWQFSKRREGAVNLLLYKVPLVDNKTLPSQQF